jgi:hypothetical protein
LWAFVFGGDEGGGEEMYSRSGDHVML